jgi:hypothetical protein
LFPGGIEGGQSWLLEADRGLGGFKAKLDRLGLVLVDRDEERMDIALEGVIAEDFGQCKQHRLLVLGAFLAAACFVPLRHLLFRLFFYFRLF